MVWFVITLTFSTLLDIVRIGRLSDQEKGLEIMILRHQLDILARKQKKPIKPSQAEKFTLAILVNKLRQTTNRPSNQLKTVIRLFQPETVLKMASAVGSSQMDPGQQRACRPSQNQPGY